MSPKKEITRREKRLNILERLSVKIGVTIATSTIVAIASTMFSTTRNWKYNSLIAFIICVCISINIIYENVLENLRRNIKVEYDKAIKEMDAFREMFEGLYQRMNEESEGINRIANDILERGIINKDSGWTFDKESEKICQEVFKFIRNISTTGRDSQLNVLYTRRKDNDEEVVITVGYANNRSERPEIYNVERKINEGTAYKDAALFRDNSPHPFYRLKADDVDKVLFYNNRESESGKFEQCIFIPVMCDKEKMIGVLEVFARKDTIIAETKEEINKIIVQLEIFVVLLLLLQKAYKAACAIPKEEGVIKNDKIQKKESNKKE